MQNSQVNTLDVPETGSPNPATLFKAAQTPIRLVVVNTGSVLVLLAHDPTTLTNAPQTANTFRLVVGSAGQTFVLAPGQGLYACSVGAGGSVSIAASEALPIA